MLITLGLLAISFSTSNALICHICQGSSNPECNLDTLPSTTTIPVCTAPTGSSCLTFVNKYDNNNKWRGCSNTLWAPDYLVNNTNTCALDYYSNELFCNCNTDLCNKDNTGSLAIFNTNECTSNPCVNGSCTDLYNGFQCN